MSEFILNHPEHRFPEKIQPIHPELKQLMFSTARYINAADEEVASRLVDDLNRKANETDMLGEVFQLTSDHLIQTRLSINSDGLIEVSGYGGLPIPAGDYANTAQGVFAGFGYYLYDRRRTLMYRLETLTDESVLSVEVVTAPVVGTEVGLLQKETLVHVGEPPLDQKMIDFALNEPEAYRSFKILAQVDNPSFQKYLYEMMLHFNTPTSMKAATIAHIGTLSTKLINHKAVEKDEVAQGALADLLNTKLTDRHLRWVTGEYVTNTDMGDGNVSVEIDSVRSLIELGGIAMMNEYRLEGSRISHFSDTRFQPAFIVNRPHDQYYFIPLSRITEFALAEPDDPSCDASLQRFRTDYDISE